MQSLAGCSRKSGSGQPCSPAVRTDSVPINLKIVPDCAPARKQPRAGGSASQAQRPRGFRCRQAGESRCPVVAEWGRSVDADGGKRGSGYPLFRDATANRHEPPETNRKARFAVTSRKFRASGNFRDATRDQPRSRGQLDPRGPTVKGLYHRSGTVRVTVGGPRSGLSTNFRDVTGVVLPGRPGKENRIRFLVTRHPTAAVTETWARTRTDTAENLRCGPACGDRFSWSGPMFVRRSRQPATYGAWDHHLSGPCGQCRTTGGGSSGPKARVVGSDEVPLRLGDRRVCIFDHGKGPVPVDMSACRSGSPARRVPKGDST